MGKDKDKKGSYGYELILDLHDCDPTKFNRTSLRKYFIKLCKEIKMKRCEVHFWDDYGVPKAQKQTSPQQKGTSAVQFILTSSIVIHTLDLLETVYINIFSCTKFDQKAARKLSMKWFRAKSSEAHFIERH